MKTLVLYKSKTGFVKKYAQWIAEELQGDLIEASGFSRERFEDYDAVVYGGGLYHVGINGVKIITDNLDRLEGKKIAVFASGASPARKEILPEVRNMNFTQEQQSKIAFFYLRGGFDYNRLNTIDRLLMKLLKLKIKLKAKMNKTLVPDEKGMLSAYDKPVDFTQKKNLDELLAYLK